jgi:glycosyltransferase involved in cell wall biosynthesis
VKAPDLVESYLRSMIQVAYDITALADSPHGGVAQVCYHTLLQAGMHPDINPVAFYRSGPADKLPELKAPVRKLNPVLGSLSPRYDIAHSLCHRTLNVRARKKVYLVHDIWSLYPNPYQSADFQIKVGRRLRRDILKADYVLTHSETTRANLLSLDLIPAEKCDVVHLGWSPPTENSTGTSGSGVIGQLIQRQYVLYVGCLEVRKNLGHVVDAVRPLESVHLVIAGHPGYGYEDRVRPGLESFPQDRLHLLDVVGKDDLVALYRHAVALLLPSWEEGFGLPIVEAMACGCPVITSNRSANAEIGGDGAILIDPENPAESNLSVERLIDDPEYRAEKIEKGRRRASLFTWKKYFDRLVEIYRWLLGR